MAEMYEARKDGKGAAGKPPEPLWDPKYAAVGVVAIALAVAIIDLLPGFIRSKLQKVTAPDENFPISTSIPRE